MKPHSGCIDNPQMTYYLMLVLAFEHFSFRWPEKHSKKRKTYGHQRGEKDKIATPQVKLIAPLRRRLASRNPRVSDIILMRQYLETKLIYKEDISRSTRPLRQLGIITRGLARSYVVSWEKLLELMVDDAAKILSDYEPPDLESRENPDSKETNSNLINQVLKLKTSPDLQWLLCQYLSQIAYEAFCDKKVPSQLPPIRLLLRAFFEYLSVYHFSSHRDAVNHCDWFSRKLGVREYEALLSVSAELVAARYKGFDAYVQRGLDLIYRMDQRIPFRIHEPSKKHYEGWMSSEGIVERLDNNAQKGTKR